MEEDWGLHDEVQAAVAVGLGVCDIVLSLEEGDVVLLQKGLRQLIDVRRVGADDPHPRDVAEVFLDALHRQGQALALELLQDALRGLEPGLDGLDGVAVILEGQLLVEHVELGLDLHHGAAVAAHQLPVGPGVGLEPVLDLPLAELRQQELLQDGAGIGQQQGAALLSGSAAWAGHVFRKKMSSFLCIFHSIFIIMHEMQEYNGTLLVNFVET